MNAAVGTRIMGVDYGERRIGLSLSDPLCLIAQPWDMLTNSGTAAKEIADRAKREGVTTIVVGLPLSLSGRPGRKALEVRDFIARLRESTSAEVIEWDERFTSVSARQSLREIEPKRKNRNERTGRLDAMAAAILLQSFLDSTKHSRVC